jgi:hypothetical protein
VRARARADIVRPQQDENISFSCGMMAFSVPHSGHTVASSSSSCMGTVRSWKSIENGAKNVCRTNDAQSRLSTNQGQHTGSRSLW